MLLAGGLALTVAGCGGDDGGPEGVSDPIVVDSGDGQTSADEPTTEQTSGPGEATSSATASPETTSTPPDADLREVSFAVDVQRALRISAETAGADEVVPTIDLDFSEHYGAWVWTVETLTGGTDHEVEIDADTGAVLDHEQDSGDDERAVDPTDPMTPERAMELATAEVDGPVRAWQLQWDDGAKVYEVEIGSGDEDEDVIVAVDSGQVTVDD